MPSGSLGLEAEIWRRLARWGASGPDWFLRLSPPLVGAIACALSAEPRRFVHANLRRVRGSPPGPLAALRDGIDVARTFAAYASCMAEVLGASASRGLPEAVVWGELSLLEAIAYGRGIVLATAHTGGWEAVGPLLSRDHGLPVMIAEQSERDPRANAIQDAARRTHGLLVARVGEDPLSALPLVRHLRGGGAVALQIDRSPARQRAREVTLFGVPGRIPEGPLRLASLTGAPVVPLFAARTGHRRYVISVEPPIRVSRAARDSELDAVAQTLAAALERFVRARPTQWFHFRES